MSAVDDTAAGSFHSPQQLSAFLQVINILP